MSLKYRIISTPLGFAAYVAGPRGLRRVFLPAASERSIRATVRREFATATEDTQLLPHLATAIGRYCAGHAENFDVALDTDGATPFEIAVWQACRRIGHGRTSTYGELARRVGRPGAARAVGGAMAHNPCPLVVPCHRVLRSDGALGGFSGPGGLALKRRLLALEATAEG